MTQRKYRAHQYPLITRILNRTIIVTSPDFHFPVPVTSYLGSEDLSTPDAIGKLGRALRIAFAQIEAMLENLDAAKEGHPTPISVEDAVPRPPKTVSLKEGCFITGLKPDALRALGDRGLVKMALTSGGHRRFERAALERYLDGPRPFRDASN